MPDVEDLVDGLYANRVSYSNKSYSVESVFCYDKNKASNLKEAIVQYYKSRNVETVYVGDNHSDLAPAKCADTVFAKEPLSTLCDGEGIDYVFFNQFGDVLKRIKNGKK